LRLPPPELPPGSFQAMFDSVAVEKLRMRGT
jgi:hypothetical protein